VTACRRVLHKISFVGRELVKSVKNFIQGTLVGLDRGNFFGQRRHALDELGSRRRVGRCRGSPQLVGKIGFYDPAFFPPNTALMLSNSSILAPCLRMITLCWITDSVLFQAQ